MQFHRYSLLRCIIFITSLSVLNPALAVTTPTPGKADIPKIRAAQTTTLDTKAITNPQSSSKAATDTWLNGYNLSKRITDEISSRLSLYISWLGVILAVILFLATYVLNKYLKYRLSELRAQEEAKLTERYTTITQAIDDARYRSLTSTAIHNSMTHWQNFEHACQTPNSNCNYLLDLAISNSKRALQQAGKITNEAYRQSASDIAKNNLGFFLSYSTEADDRDEAIAIVTELCSKINYYHDNNQIAGNPISWHQLQDTCAGTLMRCGNEPQKQQGTRLYEELFSYNEKADYKQNPSLIPEEALARYRQNYENLKQADVTASKPNGSD